MKQLEGSVILRGVNSPDVPVVYSVVVISVLYSSRFMLRNSMGACMMPTSPRLPKPASPVGVRGQVGPPVLYPMAFAPSPAQQTRMMYPTSPVRPPALVPPFYQPTSPQQTFYEPPPVTKRMAEQVRE